MSPSIFIATHNADDYREILAEKLGAELEIATVSDLEAVGKSYSSQPIVLARPDFAAELFQSNDQAATSAQWLQSTWAGVKPLIALPHRGYQLTSVKDVFGPQMAEYILGYILRHELIIEQRDQSQTDKQWNDTSSNNLDNKTIGIMGTGSIGSYVARMAEGFGMTPIGYNASGDYVEHFDDIYTADELCDFIMRSDYVVGILPDVPETDGLIDADALGCFKESALLINVGRGNLIDEPALCDALYTGCLAGAVLDVFRKEPLPKDSPLWSAKNCTITAHVAAVSKPEDIVEIFVQNYRRFCAGKHLRHLVDFDKGY